MTGFVYIWRDRKHKRYYIGSHWGTPNDGYICSSNWMRDSYRRRPEDFKRRILINGIVDRISLYEEEQRWFNFIKKEEIGKRYYNLSTSVKNHWCATSLNEVSEQISNSKIGKLRKPHSEETKRKIGLANKGKPSHNKGKPMSTEQKQKIGQSNKISQLGKKLSDETKMKISKTNKEIWNNR